MVDLTRRIPASFRPTPEPPQPPTRPSNHRTTQLPTAQAVGTSAKRAASPSEQASQSDSFAPRASGEAFVVAGTGFPGRCSIPRQQRRAKPEQPSVCISKPAFSPTRRKSPEQASQSDSFAQRGRRSIYPGSDGLREEQHRIRCCSGQAERPCATAQGQPNRPTANAQGRPNLAPELHPPSGASSPRPALGSALFSRGACRTPQGPCDHTWRVGKCSYLQKTLVALPRSLCLPINCRAQGGPAGTRPRLGLPLAARVGEEPRDLSATEHHGRENPPRCSPARCACPTRFRAIQTSALRSFQHQRPRGPVPIDFDPDTTIQGAAK